ncbi:hypothetical protein HYDPIDRAFT_168929 [Hydnomerulius pinastri MD-312]|uniref:C2H2-type domain-containing protein n=1 Tax=Hydnomerulius pinastri MD-312 TaxID=994086 RepID=A0A0C9W6H6_9AGAM|nr:hypothetical protein HYDPIDRAFT_168929 [Hydnomerulius pinastri MD-312]
MPDETFCQTCVCGRTFTGISAFTRHERGCKRGKKRLSGALARAREVYQSKRIRIQEPVDQAAILETDLDPEPGNLSQHNRHGHDRPNLATTGNLPQPATEHLAGATTSLQVATTETKVDEAGGEPQSNDDGLSLAQRRPRRLNRRLPTRFRDFVPEPHMPLPPAEVQANSDHVELADPPHPPSSSVPPPLPPAHAPSHQKIKTQLNSFGLFRLYDANSLPTHDPDTNDPSDDVKDGKGRE